MICQKKALSFSQFKFEKLVKIDWEKSKFKQILEQKFLFVFFRLDGDKISS